MTAPLTVRLAWREVVRHKVRSLLIVLLVLVPVAAVTFAAVQLSDPARDEADVQLGSLGATARVERLRGYDGDHPCTQQSLDEPACPNGDAEKLARIDAAPLSALSGPVETETVAHLGAELTGGSSRDVEVRVVDLTAPHAGDRYHRPPAAPGPDEVLVEGPTFPSDGLGVGTTVTIDGHAYRVADTLVSLQHGSGALVVGPGHPLAAQVAAAPDAAPRAYVYGSEPTRAQVDELNAHGLGVRARSALWGYDSGYDSATVIPYVLGLGLGACLLTATVSGAAFAISVSQQRRSLALLSATGASGGTLQRVVLWQGGLLGSIGAVLGAVLGTSLGIAEWNSLQEATGSYPSPPAIRWFLIVGVALLGVGSTVVAAWWPARGIARDDVLTVVREAEAPQQRPRTPWFGLALVLGGLLAGGIGVQVLSRGQIGWDGGVPVERVIGPTSIGVFLMALGVLVATSWLLWSLAFRVRGGPLAWRLAWRDAARHRSRAAACIAASLATATLVTGFLVANESLQRTDDARYEAAYKPRWPLGTVTVDDAGPDTAKDLVPMVEQHLAHVTGQGRIGAFMHCDQGLPGHDCLPAVSVDQAPATCVERQCTWSMTDLSVYSDEAFRALAGREPTGEEKAAVAAGKVLAFHAGLVQDGTVSTRLSGSSGLEPAPLPAVLVSDSPVRAALASETVLKRLDPAGAVKPGTLVVRTDATGIRVDGAPLVQALRDAGKGTLADQLRVETGPPQVYGTANKFLALAGLGLMVVISSIAAALSLRDSFRNRRTLATLGARSSTLHVVAGLQAAVTTGLGSLLGLLVGAGGMAAGIASTRGAMPLGVPWEWVALVALGAPLATGILVALLTPTPRPKAVRAA